MSDRALQHRRLHNLLLIQKLLSLRDSSSPFTLVLDSVEQSAKPLISRFIQNAKAAKADIVFISYETLAPPAGVSAFIKARRKTPAMVKEEIDKFTSTSKRALLIIDTLQPLTNNTTQHPPSLPLPTFLASLTSPSTSLLAIYHTDIPIPHPSSSSSPPSHHTSTPTTTTTPFYTPPPPLLLRYLATTLLATHSFAQTLSRKRAQDISGPIPLFGIEEGKDGVLVGMGANDKRGCVVEMEYRRKSGRGVKEWFFLSGEAGTGVGVGAHGISGSGSEGVSLLDDHPLFKIPEIGDEGAGLGGDMEMEKATFELGLSEKQRRDREGVVLPYLDAQRGEGGMGGRILYDLGVEDDFDEEEDEI